VACISNLARTKKQEAPLQQLHGSNPMKQQTNITHIENSIIFLCVCFPSVILINLALTNHIED
jgi:hypothetical protein